MRRKSTLFVFLFSFAVIASQAQTAGDYRTNTAAAMAQWTAASTWETYNGTTWVPAVSSPTSANGVITISAGDSIQLTGASITIDQVQIANTASLLIFSATTTVNNVASEDDIVVDGRLYIASGGVLTTSTGATVNVNAPGYMQIRNGGVLSTNTTNLGTMELNLSTLTNVTVTNNNMLRFIETFPAPSNYNVSMNNGAIVNNGTIEVTAANNVLFSGVTGTNTITNASGASIRKLTSAGVFGTNNSGTGVAVTNSGTIGGIGSISFSGAPSSLTNTGTISPGTPVGIMTVTPNAITGQSPIIGIGVLNGSGPGTGNDRLDVSGSVNLSGSTLTVFNQGSAPIGTYTIMTTTAGTFSGTFAAVNLPPNYGNLVIGATTITVDKQSFILPVQWGAINVFAKNGQVHVNWQTLTEVNTSHFVIEHSLDGRNFSSVGTVSAKLNSSETVNYNFVHASPNPVSVNYYRIRQVDVDGKSSYSALQAVRLNSANANAIELKSTVVNDKIELLANRPGLNIRLMNAGGALVRTQKLSTGLQSVDMQGLKTGSYYLAVYDSNNQQLTVARVVKL